MDNSQAEHIKTISSLFEDAPALVALLRGPDHIYEYANKIALAAVRKDAGVIGQPVRNVLPELEGQHIFELLDQVYQTGKQVRIEGLRADIDVHSNGIPEEMYFNLVCMPVENDAGEVSGIFLNAVDISNSMRDKKAAEQSRLELLRAQEKLRTAIEVAKLGTWERNLLTGEIDMNDRLWEWRGHKKDNSIATALQDISDPGYVDGHLKKAMEPGSDGAIDMEYEIRNDKGEVKKLHSQGKVFFDADNKPVLMAGITHDVTEQRLNEAALAKKVEIKTAELADANEGLKRSNENLEQFVYIASHDLQEPLRKINVFTDMLIKSDGNLTAEGRIYLHKIEKSAKRMSMLINNLLEFSKISSKEGEYIPTDLNKIILDIRQDYELLTGQTNAEFEIDNLPTVEAVPLQMQQLFFNLIGNALKFAKKDQPLRIRIRSRPLSEKEAADKKLNASFPYCEISVCDTGIGFDSQYSLKIFELFQRLHGKQEYAGTGIGLSLARKIVESHGGMISASSAENEGAIFTVVLPMSRS